MDHLKYYEKFLNEFQEMFVNSLNHTKSRDIFLAVNLMQAFQKRINELERIHEIRNCDIYLPDLGTYVSSSEFVARDYREGQHHKILMLLLERGVLVAFVKKGAGKSTFRGGVLEFDSFFKLDMVEPDKVVNCIRLRDHVLNMTSYKVKDKTSLRGKSKMRHFVDRILEMKNASALNVIKLTEMNNDVADREAINIGVARKNLQKFAQRGAGKNNFF